MAMLPYATIKADYENGHEYMEYWGKFGEWDYTIVMDVTDPENEELILEFTQFEAIATFGLDMHEFLAMSKLEFHNFANAGIYYNVFEPDAY